MKHRVHYEEVAVRTALNRVKGMGFEWSLNPYQGCVHGCHYCYARQFHTLRDQDPDEGFQSSLKVKINVEAVLRRELRRPSWHRQQVAIGTATDPYQPAEARYSLTRSCLIALNDHRTPISLVTKGTLILRDADILAAMDQRAGATVIFSLTTICPDRWPTLEPGTSPPRQRLKVMSRLRRAGVHVGVLLAPILPGLTDDHENIRQVVEAAAEHGAQFLGSQLVYLKVGAKEHFLEFLQGQYPQLLAEYRRLFPGNYAPKRFYQQIDSQVESIKREYGLAAKPKPLKQQIKQLSLFQ